MTYIYIYSCSLLCWHCWVYRRNHHQFNYLIWFLSLSLSHLMFDNELKILWHKEKIMESVGRTSKYKFKRDRLKIPLNRCFILVFFPMVNCFSFLCCIIGFFFFLINTPHDCWNFLEMGPILWYRCKFFYLLIITCRFSGSWTHKFTPNLALTTEVGAIWATGIIYLFLNFKVEL